MIIMQSKELRYKKKSKIDFSTLMTKQNNQQLTFSFDDKEIAVCISISDIDQ